MMKRRTFLGASLAVGMLVACSTEDSGGSGKVKIGAVTFVSHPSLDLIYEGIKEGLADAGYTEGENLEISLENPQGDQSTLATIANTFANSDNDLFVAIATPPAQALAQVIDDRPIIFASVTDPVEAGLVESMDKPGANITGTSDQLPADRQFEVLQRIMPDLATIGIVHSSGEVNSGVQAAAMKEAAQAKGVSVEITTVTNSSEVQQAAESLDVDAYYLPNDNTVVSALESLLQVAEQNKRFVFCSDADSVARGAGASYSTDYKAQGVQTAGMIAKILDGAEPVDVPVEIQESLELTVNPQAAQRMGVEIPDDVLAEADNTV